ncbi:MAG: hypothetical protein AMXMBFR64_25590 [Myxococcales bacterium]
MSALIGSVTIASILGSLHCMGMCGGLVAFWAGTDRSRGRARLGGLVAYNGARASIYVTLGLVAGGIGAAVDVAGEAAGLQRAAAVLAGSTMVAWGVIALLRVLGVRLGSLGVPDGLRRATTRVIGALRGHHPVLRAAAMGLLTAILPCGWLYAFVITAAGAGSALGGAAVMAAFWAGTLPVLVGLGAGLQAVSAPLRRHLPAVTAVALVVVGLLSIVGRAGIEMPSARASHTASVPSDAPCHGPR